MPTPIVNQSYFSNTHSMSENRLEILGQSELYDIQQEYNDMNREYQFKGQFGLNPREAEISHFDQMRKLSQTVLIKIKTYQIRKKKERVRGLANEMKKKLYQDETLKAIAVPISFLFSVFSGNTFEIDFHRCFKFSGWAMVPARAAQFQLVSSFEMGSFDISYLTKGQKLTASFNKELIPHLSGGVSYQDTGGTLQVSYHVVL